MRSVSRGAASGSGGQGAAVAWNRPGRGVWGSAWGPRHGAGKVGGGTVGRPPCGREWRRALERETALSVLSQLGTSAAVNGSGSEMCL